MISQLRAWLNEVEAQYRSYPKSDFNEGGLMILEMVREKLLEISPIDRRRPARPLPEINEGLSPRQNEIIELRRTGMSIREIAARLRISPGTVNMHVQKARDRIEGLGVDRRRKNV